MFQECIIRFFQKSKEKVVKKTHALKELFDSLFDKSDVEPYLMNVSDFCEEYDNLLEDGNVEFLIWSLIIRSTAV